MRGRLRWSRSARTGSTLARLVAVLALVCAGACGDGPDTCRMQQHEDGSRTMICPDGSSVRLPGTGERQPPGGVRGTARLFGREAHAGIRVELAGNDLSAVTAADGSYEIAGVPAGVHKVRFDAPGYERRERSQVLVLPGAWVTEDVELEIGRRILEGRDWTLVPSPRGDIFLARRENLFLVEPQNLAARRIATQVQGVRFSPDGAKIVITTGPRSDRPLTLELYEVDGRRKTKVADDVTAWHLTPDGDSIVMLRQPEGRTLLEVYHHPTGRHTAVAQDVTAWRVSPSGGALVALASTTAGRTLVVWDLAAAGGTGLGDVASRGSDTLPAFAPDGRSFVFETAFGDFVLWDGRRSETRVLEPAISTYAFGPAGDRLVYVTEGALVHRDLRTDSRFEIATSVIGATFSPDGETVAYFRDEGGSFVLSTWDAATRASTRRAVTERPAGMRFSPDGSQLFLLDTSGVLRAWSVDGLRTVSDEAHGLPVFGPDGRSYVFHEAETLVFARTDTAETVPLGAPVLDFPVQWDASGTRLFFVTGNAPSRLAYGSGWLFHADTRALERVGTGTFLAGAHFLDDGTLLLLRRFDPSGFRGELALGDTVLGTGVPDGFVFTPDGARVLFRTDALPIRETGVLALWDGAPSAPCRDVEPGVVPVDADVTDQVVGRDYLAWVSQPAVEPSAPGVYVSLWPRDMPEPEPDPDAGEIDVGAGGNEAETLLPNETNE